MHTRRLCILATTAIVGLAGMIAPAAVASSHWSSTKCNNEYEAWRKHYIKKKHTEKQFVKSAEAYFKLIDKKHGCHLGFGKS